MHTSLSHESYLAGSFLGQIDVEGSEYESLIPSLWDCTFPINIRMILIEIHTIWLPLSTASWNVHRLFLGLAHAGYTIYYKEPNTYGCGGNCIEYAFVRTDIADAPIGYGNTFSDLT